MEKVLTFDQIMFDLLVGVNENIMIEFQDIRNRVKFYLKIQEEGFDNQISVDVATLMNLHLYKKGKYRFIPKVVYRQINENQFEEMVLT